MINVALRGFFDAGHGHGLQALRDFFLLRLLDNMSSILDFVCRVTVDHWRQCITPEYGIAARPCRSVVGLQNYE